MFKNIILFGFRYTGKSTIGKAIAEINGLTFIDVDDEIEKQEKKSIHDITHNGKKWEKFRTLEYEMLQKWIDEKDVVISCG